MGFARWPLALLAALAGPAPACQFLPDGVGGGETDGPVAGSDAGPGAPDGGAGPSPDLGEFIAGRMEAAGAPGLAAAIVRRGEVAWAEGFGLAEIETGRAVTADTAFMLASVSKTVVATAVMQLVEQGTLALDTDVNVWLPFSLSSPTAPDRPITLRALLTRTAGLRDNWDTLDETLVDGDSPISLAEWVRAYFAPEGDWYDATENFQSWGPAGGYEYANVDADVAAYVVELASGTPFDEYCRAHLFVPLGMTSTAWHLAGLDPAELAVPYGPDTGTMEFVPYGHYGYAGYPEGQLRASVRDLGAFLAAMTQKGLWKGTRILGEGTADEMFAVQVPALAPEQAVAWYYEDDPPGLLLGHEGSDLGAATIMMMRPADGTGAIVLANGDWNDTDALYEVLYRLFEEAARL